MSESSLLAEKLNKHLEELELSAKQLHITAEGSVFSWLQTACPSIFGEAPTASRTAEIVSWALRWQASLAEKEEAIQQLNEIVYSLESRMWFEKVFLCVSLMLSGALALLFVLCRMRRAFRKPEAENCKPRSRFLTAEDALTQPEEGIFSESAHPEESREAEAEAETEAESETEIEADAEIEAETEVEVETDVEAESETEVKAVRVSVRIPSYFQEFLFTRLRLVKALGSHVWIELPKDAEDKETFFLISFHELHIRAARNMIDRLVSEELVCARVAVAPEKSAYVAEMTGYAGPIAALEKAHKVHVILPEDYALKPVIIVGMHCLEQAVKAFQEALDKTCYRPATLMVSVHRKDFDLILGADRTHTTYIEETFGVKVFIALPEKEAAQLKVRGPHCQLEKTERYLQARVRELRSQSEEEQTVSVACPPAFVYSNPELMDAIKSVIYKHGIQVTLPDAAAGHTQILITGFEDYAKAAADELEQCLKLQREKLLQLEGETQIVTMKSLPFKPEEVRIALGLGRCHVKLVEEWFGIRVLVQCEGQPFLLRGSEKATEKARAFLKRFVAEKLAEVQSR